MFKIFIVICMVIFAISNHNMKLIVVFYYIYNFYKNICVCFITLFLYYYFLNLYHIKLRYSLGLFYKQFHLKSIFIKISLLLNISFFLFKVKKKKIFFFYFYYLIKHNFFHCVNCCKF